MSFHYWRNNGQAKKTQFVSLKGSYHGETLGALSVTDVALFKDTYAPLLRGSVQVQSPDWRLAEPGESAHDYALRAAIVLKDHLEQHRDETAALIIEPLVQGAAGMVMYDAAYLTEARRLCNQYDVHLIADEIMTGFGRTGTFFAHEQACLLGKNAPDFLCLSKGITGGYLPLSVVMTRDAIYEAFYDDNVTRGFLHSHSYTGNALACRAALATLEIFERDDVINHNRATAARITKAAQPIATHPRVKHFRQAGMIWAFDVDTINSGFSRAFHMAALDKELLLRPIGNTVYFMPPYVINDEEIELLTTRTLQVLQTCA